MLRRSALFTAPSRRLLALLPSNRTQTLPQPPPSHNIVLMMTRESYRFCSSSSSGEARRPSSSSSSSTTNDETDANNKKKNENSSTSRENKNKDMDKEMADRMRHKKEYGFDPGDTSDQDAMTMTNINFFAMWFLMGTFAVGLFASTQINEFSFREDHKRQKRYGAIFAKEIRDARQLLHEDFPVFKRKLKGQEELHSLTHDEQEMEEALLFLYVKQLDDVFKCAIAPTPEEDPELRVLLVEMLSAPKPQHARKRLVMDLLGIDHEAKPVEHAPQRAKDALRRLLKLVPLCQSGEISINKRVDTHYALTPSITFAEAGGGLVAPEQLPDLQLLPDFLEQHPEWTEAASIVPVFDLVSLKVSTGALLTSTSEEQLRQIYDKQQLRAKTGFLPKAILHRVSAKRCEPTTTTTTTTGATPTSTEEEQHADSVGVVVEGDEKNKTEEQTQDTTATTTTTTTTTTSPPAPPPPPTTPETPCTFSGCCSLTPALSLVHYVNLIHELRSRIGVVTLSTRPIDINLALMKSDTQLVANYIFHPERLWSVGYVRAFFGVEDSDFTKVNIAGPPSKKKMKAMQEAVAAATAAASPQLSSPSSSSDNNNNNESSSSNDNVISSDIVYDSIVANLLTTHRVGLIPSFILTRSFVERAQDQQAAGKKQTFVWDEETAKTEGPELQQRQKQQGADHQSQNHSMLLLGERQDPVSGKIFFLCQNFWEKSQFLEIEREYLSKHLPQGKEMLYFASRQSLLAGRQNPNVGYALDPVMPVTVYESRFEDVPDL